jgi:hypothetical protein
MQKQSLITQSGSAATELQPANDANEREYKSTRSGGFTTAEILANSWHNLSLIRVNLRHSRAEKIFASREE